MRIRGELAKLGIRVSASAIRTPLSKTWARSGATTRRSDLGGVPAQPGTRDPGDRLLHRRDHLAPHALRLLLHRARDAACPSGRRDRALRLRVGHAGCPQPLVGPARAGTLSLSDQGDSKYTRSFDAVFAADGIAAILTRSALRGRTLSPNDGSAPSDVNALTGRSSSVGVTSTGGSATTSPTTTPSGRTAGSICERLTHRRIPQHRFSVSGACEDATSWAASSMSTNWSRDAESRVSVPFTPAPAR